MKRVLLIYSHLIWTDPATAGFCRRLRAAGVDVHALALNRRAGSGFERALRDAGIPTHHIHLGGKLSIPLALLRTMLLILRLRPVAVHTHLLEANLIGLTAARLLGIPARIHTRHHADFNHRHNRRALRWDKISNWLSTRIVATSLNVRRVLVEMDRVPAEKVALVYHGIDADRFMRVPAAAVEAVRSKHGIPSEGPVIGMFSRYVFWKGWEYALPAFAEVKKRFPGAFFVFANSFPTEFRRTRVEPLLRALPAGGYVEIESEPEVQALYRCLDVFVHVPVDATSEAYGLVYGEALLSGVPSVFTLSGIAPEIVRDGENALVVPFRDSTAIADAITRLWSDSALRARLRESGGKDMRFTVEQTVRSTMELYR